MLTLSKKNLFKVVFLISLIALSFAYFVEFVLGHQPCNLCLLERVPYFLSIIIVLINYKYKIYENYLILLLSIVFFAATLLSLYHLGIEEGFFQESLICAVDNGSIILDKEEILKQLQQKNISCKDVTFKIFGLSLTSYNIVISLLLTIALTKIYFGYEKNR